MNRDQRQPPARGPQGRGAPSSNNNNGRKRGAGPFDEFESPSFWTTPVIVGSGFLLLTFCIAVIALVGAGIVFHEMPDISGVDTLTNKLRGVHAKHFRLYFQRNAVFGYNLTVTGTIFSQGGVVITNGPIPGSGYLINNKRSVQSAGAGAYDPTADEIALLRSEDPSRSARAIPPQYRPKPRYRGLNILDDSNITMAGGDIVGVGSIYANQIVQSFNATAAFINDTALQVGRAIGFLPNGSIGVGFADTPLAREPLVNEALNLATTQGNLLQLVRFNEDAFAFLYQSSAGGDVLARSGIIDPVTNRPTYTGSTQVLAPLTLTTFRACSFEAADGTGANTVAIVYLVPGTGLLAQVCDLSNANASACYSAPVLMQVDNSTVIQSIACQVHAADVGTNSPRRWISVAFTNTVAGFVFSQRFNASVSAVTPSDARTANRQIGLVTDLTNVSTSNDLANQPNGAIDIEYLMPGYIVVAWRTGTSLTEGRLEVEYINATALTMDLATRAPFSFVTPADNINANSWVFDMSPGVPSPSSGIAAIFTAFNIGESITGYLQTTFLQTPVSPATTFGPTPWVYVERSEFAPNVNSLFAFNSAGTLSVSAVCSSQAVITYSTASGYVEPQQALSVLASVKSNQTCIATQSCVALSTPAVLSLKSAYLLQTVWNSLARSAFDCAPGGFTPFFSAFTVLSDFDNVNSSVYLGVGVAGTYSISYAPLDVPRTASGIITGVFPEQGLVTYQSGGSINVCDANIQIDGLTCPFEAAAPVYACYDGSLSFSPYCTSGNVQAPAQLIGQLNPGPNGSWFLSIQAGL